MGIVGLETAFPLLYTNLVLPGIITLDRLTELMCTTPAKRFGIPAGFENDCCTVFRTDTEYTIDPQEFLSMGRNTPFTGWKVRGACALTVCRGKIVYDDGSLPRRREINQ